MCLQGVSVEEDWINPCFLEEQGGLPLVRVSLMQTVVLFTKAACKVRLDSSLPSPSLRLCPPPVLWLVGTALICAPPIHVSPWIGHGNTSLDHTSLGGRIYSRDLECWSLRSSAPWHILGRAALLEEAWLEE